MCPQSDLALMRAATAQLAVREEALQGRPTNSVGDRPAAISSAFTNTTQQPHSRPHNQPDQQHAVYTSYLHMRCWLLAVGPTYLSRILANAALNNTQVVTKLRLYVTEQACPRPNMSVVDERTVCKCVSPIIALLLSTTGGIAGTTTDALGSARFTAASANPEASVSVQRCQRSGRALWAPETSSVILCIPQLGSRVHRAAGSRFGTNLCRILDCEY
jgi:hypothetical protein